VQELVLRFGRHLGRDELVDFAQQMLRARFGEKSEDRQMAGANDEQDLLGLPNAMRVSCAARTAEVKPTCPPASASRPR
jgi:hypothetical protein